MAEPKEKLKNFKVLSVEKSGSYEKDGKTVQLHKIVLEGVNDKTKILVGDAKEPLPETVVKDGIVDDVWVYENDYQGNKEIRLFFPSPKGSGGSFGSKSYSKPEDIHLKIVSFAYSYQKDMAIASGLGELSYDEFYKEARNMAVHMLQDYTHLKTL